MKLQAKARLQAAMSLSEREELPARLTSILAPLGLNWKPVRQVSRGDSYPSLGQLSTPSGTGYREWLSVRLGSPDLTKGVVLDIGINVDASNEIHQGSSGLATKAQKWIKEAAAKLKAVGKVKIVKPSPTSKVQVPSLTVIIPASRLGAAKWGIEVVGDQGNRNVWTSTPHSHGPWSSKDEAASHISDLKNHLAYDDDFKHPLFRVVQV